MAAPARQPHHIRQHLHLQPVRHLVIQGGDRLPLLFDAEDVPHGDVGGGDFGGAAAGGELQAAHEADAHRVDEIPGDAGRGDFPPQGVGANLIAIGSKQPRREGILRGLGEARVLRQIRPGEFLFQRVLAAGNQHRQFRPGQALAVGAALAQGGVIRNEFQFAVEGAGLFQPGDEPLMLDQAPRRFALGEADGAGLRVVVAQHEFRDAVGHRRQQLVALLAAQRAPRHPRIQQDFDIHFVVGAIHPGGVVDEIRVAAPPIAAVFHPPQLGHAEVAALPHHFAAQLRAVHAHGVVGFVADFGVAFLRCFNISADAAVPQQIHRRAQQGADEFGGS